MSIAGKNPLNRPISCFATMLLLLTAFDFVCAPNCSNAQSSEKVRSLPGQFFPEENCPVNITETRTELDIDRFDAPIDARVYVTYTNVSQNPIVAVNFRVRLSDAEGHDLGTFRGGDGFLVNAGETRSQKFKHEGIDPHVTAMQIRVLQVKYAAGNIWESSKLQELQNPNEQISEPAPTLPASMNSAQHKSRRCQRSLWQRQHKSRRCQRSLWQRQHKSRRRQPRSIPLLPKSTDQCKNRCDLGESRFKSGANRF